MISLQIYPASEQPVTHNKFDFVVARERRRQHNLRLSRVDRRSKHHITILILYIKNVVRMISLKEQGVVE